MTESASTPAGVTRWMRRTVTVEMAQWDGSLAVLELLRHLGAEPEICGDGISVNVFEADDDGEVCLSPGDWFTLTGDGIRKMAPGELGAYEPVGDRSP